ncbi:MAG: transcriptional regulator [Spirochaetae bacterium HGW-Spirochaetae-10]|nr:MAG: transcriptional regulator [Spirochaetae bacterium HGW-Spirochaetae-10]
MKEKQKESPRFQDLKQGLYEALAYSQGKTKARVHRRKLHVPPLPDYSGEDIKRIRERLNLSQKTLAAVLGVSAKTIEAWEAGRSEAHGSALRMLSILDNDEKALEIYNLVEIS